MASNIYWLMDTGFQAFSLAYFSSFFFLNLFFCLPSNKKHPSKCCLPRHFDVRFIVIVFPFEVLGVFVASWPLIGFSLSSRGGAQTKRVSDQSPTTSTAQTTEKLPFAYIFTITITEWKRKGYQETTREVWFCSSQRGEKPTLIVFRRIWVYSCS